MYNKITLYSQKKVQKLSLGGTFSGTKYVQFRC